MSLSLDHRLVLADKGYVGVQNECKSIAVALKKGRKSQRKKFSKQYWYNFNSARSQVERVFAHMFSNKFTQLSRWPGKSRDTFLEFCSNVICSIILYNVLKKHAHRF